MSLIVSSAAYHSSNWEHGHDALKKFTKHGVSIHSGRATLLPWIINWCEQNGVQYILHAIPNIGYTIKKLDTGNHKKMIETAQSEPVAVAHVVKSKSLAARNTKAKKKSTHTTRSKR